MTTHSTGSSGTIQGCGCEYCGATGAHNGFIIVASYAEPEPLALIWTKSVEYEKKSDGAVGSTEAPPNPWTGISGPAVALDLIWNRAPPEVHDARSGQIEAIEIVRSLEARIDELQSYSYELAKEIDRRNNLEQETEAYQYLKRLFLHMAPQCCVLPDLLGVCTQIDNAIAGLAIENASLKAKLAAFTAFIADQPDLPEPPRRPDGTLMPQPKALTVPRETGDKRRIGG